MDVGSTELNILPLNRTSRYVKCVY